MDEPRLIIQRFWSIDCSVCTNMKKARTLERFVEERPNLRIEDLDLAVPLNETKADELDIKGIPALVFVDVDGNAVFKHEGGLTKLGLDRVYTKALKALEEGDLGSVSRKRRRK